MEAEKQCCLLYIAKVCGWGFVGSTLIVLLSPPHRWQGLRFIGLLLVFTALVLTQSA